MIEICKLTLTNPLFPDECLSNTACGSNALCHNTHGNHTCECIKGYHGNPYDGCVDINECRLNPCGPGAKCTNHLGDYSCQVNK